MGKKRTNVNKKLLVFYLYVLLTVVENVALAPKQVFNVQRMNTTLT